MSPLTSSVEMNTLDTRSLVPNKYLTNNIHRKIPITKRARRTASSCGASNCGNSEKHFIDSQKYKPGF